jgi:hypothetical protein
VDDVLVVIDDPDVLHRIVRTDRNEVRPLQHRVVLIPRIDQVALAVEDHDAVFPPGIHAELVAGLLPRLHAALGGLTRAAVSRGAGGRGITPWKASDRKHHAGPQLGQPHRFRPAEIRQFAALEDEDAIGALRKDALSRAERPPFVPFDGREIFGPVGDDVVRAKNVLPALLTRHSPEPR